MRHLRSSDYMVRPVAHNVGVRLVSAFHYAAGGSNTATYLHGLFHRDRLWDRECLGVAWWIPPTKSTALATFPENWRGVLSLSRLVVAPDMPTNSASFLLGRSMRMIDRSIWPALVTYADSWRGHTGAIYRATNWDDWGDTSAQAVYTLDGRMVARKAGPVTRTHAEMIEMGCVFHGRHKKRKFVHIKRGRRVSLDVGQAQQLTLAGVA